MTFKLTIDCENDAFTGDDPNAELARILREVANALETTGGFVGKNVYDINGNKVGAAVFQ